MNLLDSTLLDACEQASHISGSHYDRTIIKSDVTGEQLLHIHNLLTIIYHAIMKVCEIDSDLLSENDYSIVLLYGISCIRALSTTCEKCEIRLSKANSIRQNVEKSHPPKLGYSRRFYCTKNNESKSICLCQTHIELSIKERTYDELKLLWSVDIDNHDIIIYHKYRENHMETTCQTIED